MTNTHSTDEYFLKQAIALARSGMHAGKGGPFGCVIVKDGRIVGQGSNEVTITQDPTAHAEVVAIRNACQQLGHFQLDGCTLYTSCEPCPMCLGAIYWARPDRIVYAAADVDAAEAGFDDRFIYDELEKKHTERRIPMKQLLRDEARQVFAEWHEKGDKTLY
ncbi:nucleoside deaminase [Arsenicibacter rosenii]|uniref:tRNA-specific adenosine deaminase n=1 Tax=Arsenicibacter rosenii TaxID=1750698 RepID=A0A1S2VNY1_9BACT|nr:nucleoside deaminase [Arsenicibacter rosenii]OIN59925.1 tRNA-specific adenosine deaminase [Arsenicibacter rosenii]